MILEDDGVDGHPLGQCRHDLLPFGLDHLLTSRIIVWYQNAYVVIEFYSGNVLAYSPPARLACLALLRLVDNQQPFALELRLMLLDMN